MDFVRIECPAMTQTLLGIGISLIGVLLICYREPIARLSKSMYGGLTFPLKWLSIGNLVAGILGIISGLLIAIHLAPLPY
jgi:hypothetical protein